MNTTPQEQGRDKWDFLTVAVSVFILAALVAYLAHNQITDAQDAEGVLGVVVPVFAAIFGVSVGVTTGKAAGKAAGRAEGIADGTAAGKKQAQIALKPHLDAIEAADQASRGGGAPPPTSLTTAIDSAKGILDSLG